MHMPLKHFVVLRVKSDSNMCMAKSDFIHLFKLRDLVDIRSGWSFEIQNKVSDQTEMLA